MTLWRTLAAGTGLATALLPAFTARAAKPPPAPSATPTLIVAETLPFTATASPALADIDGDGRPEIAMSVDNIGYGEPSTIDPLSDPDNPNAVYLWGWTDGGFTLLPGWPQKTRDATLGVSLIDVTGDGFSDVIGACSQDNRPPEGTPYFVSRLYAWDATAAPISPWAPWSILPPNPEGGNEAGVAVGHMYAPFVEMQGADGAARLLQASQGIYGWWDGSTGPYYPRFGALKVWSLDGTLEAETGVGTSAWAVYDGASFSRFSLDVPPVVARRGAEFDVAAATTDGVVYRWRADGEPVPGYHPSSGAKTQTDLLPGGTRALLRYSIAAADLTGDGSDEVLAASGDYGNPSSGAVYCWGSGGRLLWRYPLLGTDAAFTSGIAVGRVGGKSLAVVVGDAAGRVTAIDRRGGVMWRYETAPGTAAGQYPIAAQPVIGDVNGDNVQDVVVGGTNGFVYALNGRTGMLLWKVPTPTVETPSGAQPEWVLAAPVLCDLQADGRLDVVIATHQRYYQDGWHGFGHLLVWACGAGTYRAGQLDWPQYQQNARRTGRAGDT